MGQGVAQGPAACRVSVRKDETASHCAEKCVPHFHPTLSDTETGLSALLLAQGHYQLITSAFNFSVLMELHTIRAGADLVYPHSLRVLIFSRSLARRLRKSDTATTHPVRRAGMPTKWGGHSSALLCKEKLRLEE